MGFFDYLKGISIDDGVRQFRATEKAILMDVRTSEEYLGGHIPDAVNLPLDQINSAVGKFDQYTPLFVYCHSGARSSRAVAALRELGFTAVTDIGGILHYHGEVER